MVVPPGILDLAIGRQGFAVAAMQTWPVLFELGCWIVVSNIGIRKFSPDHDRSSRGAEVDNVMPTSDAGTG
jgi:hypothetical protein